MRALRSPWPWHIPRSPMTSCSLRSGELLAALLSMWYIIVHHIFVVHITRSECASVLSAHTLSSICLIVFNFVDRCMIMCLIVVYTFVQDGD